MCSHTDTHKSRALQVEDGYAFHTWGGCAALYFAGGLRCTNEGDTFGGLYE